MQSSRLHIIRLKKNPDDNKKKKRKRRRRQKIIRKRQGWIIEVLERNSKGRYIYWYLQIIYGSGSVKLVRNRDKAKLYETERKAWKDAKSFMKHTANRNIIGARAVPA